MTSNPPRAFSHIPAGLTVGELALQVHQTKLSPGQCQQLLGCRIAQSCLNSHRLVIDALARYLPAIDKWLAERPWEAPPHAGPEPRAAAAAVPAPHASASAAGDDADADADADAEAEADGRDDGAGGADAAPQDQLHDAAPDPDKARAGDEADHAGEAAVGSAAPAPLPDVLVPVSRMDIAGAHARGWTARLHGVMPIDANIENLGLSDEPEKMRGKAPGWPADAEGTAWSKYGGWRTKRSGQHRPLTRRNLDYVSNAGGNFGLALGSAEGRGDGADPYNLIAIDVDTEAAVTTVLLPLVRRFIIEHGGKEAMHRFGRVGRAMLILRSSEPLGKSEVRFADGRLDEHGELIEQKVELLGEGQQAVVDGTHPSDTPYRTAPPLSDVSVSELPELTREQVDELFVLLARAGQDLGLQLVAGGTTKAAHDGAPVDPKTLVGDPEEVRELLAVTPVPEERDGWVARVHAIKGATLNHLAEGRELAIGWGWQDGDGPDETAALWDSIDPRHLRIGMPDLRRFAGKPALRAVDAFPMLPVEQTEPEPAPAQRDTWKPPALVDVSAAAIANAPPPQFVIPDWLPVGMLTLFAGHGGTSKSMIALVICVLLATGRAVLGRPAGPKVPVVFFSAEDAALPLQYRLRRIASHMGVSPVEWTDTLTLVDATTTDAVLWRAGNNGNEGQVGRAWRFLAEQVGSSGAQLVVIDNASDTFDGNEIVRREVTQFVRALVRVTDGRECAVLLLAHLNRQGAQGSGEAYSGSTAWHNAARARWSVEPAKELPPGNLLLELHKSTHGRPNQQAGARIDWAAGAFELGAPSATGDMQALLREQVLPVLADLIDEAQQAGDYVSWAPQSTTRYAPNSLHSSGRVPGSPTQAELKCAVEGLIKDGLLVEGYAKDVNSRKDRKCLNLTAKARTVLGRPTGGE